MQSQCLPGFAPFLSDFTNFLPDFAFFLSDFALFLLDLNWVMSIAWCHSWIGVTELQRAEIYHGQLRGAVLMLYCIDHDDTKPCHLPPVMKLV